MAKSTKRSTSLHPPSTSALTLTFSGPFVYDFARIEKDKVVDVYAPYCPYHLGGVFFSLNSLSENDLWKCAQSRKPKEKLERAYLIRSRGIKASRGKPQIIVPKYPKGLSFESLKQTIRSTGSTEPLGPRKDKVLFKFTVPNPKYIYPLYFDHVEVVEKYDKDPENAKISAHSTGLRFVYSWNAHTPIQLVVPSGDTFDIEPPVFKELPKLADIEIRYQGLGLADENDLHSDARSCFASMAVLAGVEWWLNYGDCKSSPTNISHGSKDEMNAPGPCEAMNNRMTMENHTGGDCHAAAIVNGLD